MLPLAMLRLVTDSTLWRALHVRGAGRRLLRALGSHDENIRQMAGVLLVRGGRRSQVLLTEALERGENLPIVLSLLGDVGDEDARERLERYSRDQDPAISKSAQYALRALRSRLRSA